MGDPRKIRSKYRGPAHPWQATRIEEEKGLMHDYGLKTKTEIWKASSRLKNFTDRAKKLIAATTPQAQKEKSEFLAKLHRLGLIPKDARIEDVLIITLKDVLERRLQTLLVRKHLARTMGQSRQFITHEHVMVGKKTVSAPSYFVSVEEEPKITFLSTSTLANTGHPERAVEEKK